MSLYVYILKCSDDRFYVGLTNDPDRRLEEHQQGKYDTGYTYVRRPVEMVYVEHFPDGTHRQAAAREKQLKGWTRAKKEALIQGRLNDLAKLAECRNETRAISKSAEPDDKGSNDRYALRLRSGHR